MGSAAADEIFGEASLTTTVAGAGSRATVKGVATAFMVPGRGVLAGSARADVPADEDAAVTIGALAKGVEDAS